MASMEISPNVIVDTSPLTANETNSSQSSVVRTIVVGNVAKKKLRRYQCDICQLFCSRKTHLIAHINARHINKGESHFKCETCLNKYGSFKQLKQHQQAHNPGQHCKRCFKVIEKTMSMQKHNKLFHPGAKFYNCKYCEDNFATGNNCDRHMKLVHKDLVTSKIDNKTSKTANKMLFTTCPVPMCGKTLSLNTSLPKHLLTHNIGRADLFKCQFCTKTFIQKNNCKRHELLVHDCHEVRGVKSACKTTMKECVAAPAAYKPSKVVDSAAQHTCTTIKDLLENFYCDDEMCSHLTRPSTSDGSPSQALCFQHLQGLEKNLTVMKENVILSNNNMMMQTNFNEVAKKRNETVEFSKENWTFCSLGIAATNTLPEITEKPSAVSTKFSPVLPRLSGLTDCRLVVERLVIPVPSCKVSSETSSCDESTAVKLCQTAIRDDLALRNQALCSTKHSGVNQRAPSSPCLPLAAFSPRPKCVTSCSRAATNTFAEITEKPSAVSTNFLPALPRRLTECTVMLERLVIPSLASNDSKITSTILSGIDTAMLSNKCDICSKMYATNQTLRRHVKLVHSELQIPVYKCDACKISFSMLHHLVRHKARDHKDIASSSKCELCPKKFLLKSNLKVHLKRHGDEKLYKCDACNVAFTNARYLAAHVRDHGSHVCGVCGKNFTRARVLKYHMHLHTMETKPHQCNACGKTFNFVRNLHCHYKLHHPNNMAMQATHCVPCGKKFVSYSGYSKHVKTRCHEDNARGFECDKCRSLFSRKTTIAKHLKTDCSLKLHVCPTCGTSFSYLGNLKRHLVTASCIPCDKM